MFESEVCQVLRHVWREDIIDAVDDCLNGLPTLEGRQPRRDAGYKLGQCGRKHRALGWKNIPREVNKTAPTRALPHSALARLLGSLYVEGNRLYRAQGGENLLAAEAPPCLVPDLVGVGDEVAREEYEVS